MHLATQRCRNLSVNSKRWRHAALNMLRVLHSHHTHNTYIPHTHTPHAHTHTPYTHTHTHKLTSSQYHSLLCNTCTLDVYLATYVLPLLFHSFSIIVHATLCHVVAILYSLTHHTSLNTSVPAPYQPATYFSRRSHTHTSPSPHIPHPSTMHVPLTTTPHTPNRTCMPEEDPELKVEPYTRSPEQIALLGLDQMNVD